MAEQGQLAVVTGASSGIGKATAQTLAARGFHVLAGIRQQQEADQLAGRGIEPVVVDVTDPTQVAAVRGRVENDPGGRPLRALINNAGIALNGPVEAIPMEEWRRQLEVNFFGQIAVTQALLPALFEARGRVVNISSIGGRVVGPTFGPYSASKFAVEAISDALRREVARLGVEVIVIEPGSVATPIWEKGTASAQALVAQMTQEQGARYDELVEAVLKAAQKMASGGIAPAEVAEVIAKAIEAPRPRTRYLVGRDAKIRARMGRVLPDRAMDWVIAKSLGLGKPRATAAT